MPILMFVAWLAILSAWPAVAQDGHTHEGDVGKFYQTWRMQPLRTTGCCGNTDCRTAIETKKVGDRFEVLVFDPDLAKPKWYVVPNGQWEDRQEDPRESPDGRTHVCINAGRVICAVRGGDI